MQKYNNKIIAILFLFLILFISMFLFYRNHQQYKEWYKLKKTLTENYPGLKVKLNMKNGFMGITSNPWVDIEFYVDDSFTFDKAEAIFKVFLANFSTEFVAEMTRHRYPYAIEPLHVEFVAPTGKWDYIILYGFTASKRTDYKIWWVEKSRIKEFKGKSYNRDDY